MSKQHKATTNLRDKILEAARRKVKECGLNEDSITRTTVSDYRNTMSSDQPRKLVSQEKQKESTVSTVGRSVRGMRGGSRRRESTKSTDRQSTSAHSTVPKSSQSHSSHKQKKGSIQLTVAQYKAEHESKS